MCKGEWAEKMQRYERNAEILDGRSSFSKTDRDATFMRMKDDHMGNGQLKAAYNIQAETEGQFIIDATAHQRPGDTAGAIGHLEHAERTSGWLPGEMADAGYGSEQNYRWLDEKGVSASVKHNEFFRESSNRKWREDPMRPNNWEYDEILDTYVCPEGRTLRFSHIQHPRSDLGHRADVRLYRCESCEGCSLRERCFRSKDPDAARVLRVTPDLARFKKRASFLLNTEKRHRAPEVARRRRGDHLRRHQAQRTLHEVPPAGPKEGWPRVQARCGRPQPEETCPGPGRIEGTGALLSPFHISCNAGAMEGTHRPGIHPDRWGPSARSF
jgi:hypothetical protein